MYIHKPLRITKGKNSHRNGPSSLLFIIVICPSDMDVYARFDEIPSITLKDIKKTKHYRRMDARTDGWTDNLKFFSKRHHIYTLVDKARQHKESPVFGLRDNFLHLNTY